MKPASLLLSLGFLCFLGVSAKAQLPPEKAEKTFTVSDGLEFRLWASEPLFVNPTCMDIDHKGRVWVCESVNYRDTLHHRKLRRPAGDRIVILEDTKGTGKADKATTFYQSPGLLAPLGIAVAKDPLGSGYKVYVCQSPDILLFEDKDGDGKADGPPRKLLTGFRGIDHDHGVHGILIGPDCKLYFSVGDQGVENLQSSDGKGRKWTTNHTDCQAGTIWRCDMDGKNLELIAHNFRNEYEPCVDSFGTIFVSDNDDDGNQQTRICYVMPGGNYGYWPRGPGQSHWHEEQPGVVPKILRTYFGSPTGMCVYEGTLLPKRYWGQLLHTDAGPRHVRCYHLKPQGAGYDVDREDMVTSTDTWFRPSDICVAPDGSVFVSDWYDPGVGGHGMGDVKRGRIYRLAPKGNKHNVPEVDLQTTRGLWAALASPALSVRYLGMAKLQALPPGDTATLLRDAYSQRQNISLRARAFWQLMKLSVRAPEAIANIPQSPEELNTRDSQMMQLMLRICTDAFGGQLAEAMFPRVLLINGCDSGTRREMLVLLRNANPMKAKEFIYQLAKYYDGKDRFYLEAIGIAVGHYDQKRREIILADFDKGFPEWNQKVLNLIWELRPPKVMGRLQKQLGDPATAAEQRSQIVDIIAGYEDAGGGKVLLQVLKSNPPSDVRNRIVANLQDSLRGKWRELRQGKELSEVLQSFLARPETVPSALALIAAAARTDAISKVAGIAEDKKQPKEIRVAAVRALGELPAREAVPVLDRLAANETFLRGEVIGALGLHVKSQEKSDPNNAAFRALQKLVTSSGQEMPTRQAAGAVLAESHAGSLWLLDAGNKKQLPDAVRADVARLLRNSPYKDVRNQARAAFPGSGKLDPRKLPSPAQLAKRKGNAKHGKELVAASITSDLQCLKCHTIRGVGGSVGPDLSVIGKKASRENLFESLLIPSKAIADQYVSWVIETRKGLSVTGLLVEETANSITLRDANARDTKIEKKDIETRSKSLVSLMPNDLVASMTESELVDVVEYLLSLKTPSLTPESWQIAGPFDNGTNDSGLDRVFPPEKSIDLRASYPDKFGVVSWRTLRPNNKGYVDLQAFFAPRSANIVSYLYSEIDSPVEQEAPVLAGTDNCAKLWVNDVLVYTNRRHRAAAPDQDRFPVKLKKGRNKLVLKITNSDGPHGFYLSLLAEQELKAVASK